MKQIILKYFILIMCLCSAARAQNIVGYKIFIGEDAPAFIAFPSEIANARWDNSEMNDFFKLSTRNENTLQISYNGKSDPPASGGFSVIQGKNTHIFTLVLKKDYDINRDPPLYYDFSDKGKLKAAAEQARKNTPETAAGDPVVASDKDKRREANEAAAAEEQRKKDIAAAKEQKRKEAEAQQKEAARKAAEADKEREAEIAKAKEDARRKEQEQKKAREQEAAIEKANKEAEQARLAEAARLKRLQEEEDRKAAQAAAAQKQKEQQERDAAKRLRDEQEREAAEQKRLAAQAEQERLLREKQQQAEAERAQKAALAKEEAEAKRKAKEEADQRLAKLRQEKEEARRQEQYTMTGLYLRYQKDNINFYDIPPEQYHYNNADFYVEADTLENYSVSQKLIAEPGRLHIAADTKNQITASLESISFKDAMAYYKIRISNQSSEDYLVGANYLTWYQEDGKSLFLKCSYLSYIGFFPIVKPGETKSYIYATRAANINREDKLVFTIAERRSHMPGFQIFFDGHVYNDELARIQKETKLK
jgi:hypothetical protein